MLCPATPHCWQWWTSTTALCNFTLPRLRGGPASTLDTSAEAFTATTLSLATLAVSAWSPHGHSGFARVAQQAALDQSLPEATVLQVQLGGDGPVDVAALGVEDVVKVLPLVLAELEGVRERPAFLAAPSCSSGCAWKSGISHRAPSHPSSPPAPSRSPHATCDVWPCSCGPCLQPSRSCK